MTSAEHEQLLGLAQPESGLSRPLQPPTPTLPSSVDYNLSKAPPAVEDDEDSYHHHLQDLSGVRTVPKAEHGAADDPNSLPEQQSHSPQDSGFGGGMAEYAPTIERSTSQRSHQSIKHGDQAFEYETPHGFEQPASGAATPSRSGTLKKRQSLSLSRRSSMKRSDSRRSMARSPSVASQHSGRASGGAVDMDSYAFTPVPTSGNPTEILANRFTAWRKILKDFVIYFTDVKKSFEQRSQVSSKISATLNNQVSLPGDAFLRSGGIMDTNTVLKDFHKQAYSSADHAARAIQTDIIQHLNALRGDLTGKIKEIKKLSGDFKNTVEKEKENTRHRVNQLQQSLRAVDGSANPKDDPYIVKIGVDKQLRRQLHEENYLHKAFLNLEGSGRELESVVVDQIQKAFETYVSIIRREGEEMLDFSGGLDSTILGLERDAEWLHFVRKDKNFVDPDLKVRNFQHVTYPGCEHPSTAEIRSGLLERKSKYLKSYTPGWYALSPAFIHEFKSADRNSDMIPVMSLYLPDSRLGAHSSPSSSSHKFILKAKQMGSMHRSSGHSWTFRAESHETMLAWYEDIKKLLELAAPGVSKEERTAFVTRHRRAVSNVSQRSNGDSYSSGGEDRVDEMEEADQVAFSHGTPADLAAAEGDGVVEDGGYFNPRDPSRTPEPVRPEPGGRFPSDIQLDRGMEAHHRARSTTSGDSDRSVIAAAGILSMHSPDAPQYRTATPSSPYAPVPQHPQTSALVAQEQDPRNSGNYHAYLLEEQNRRPRMHDRNPSAFSYDERHPDSSTYVGDESFTPVRANVSPVVERKLSRHQGDSGAESYFPDAAIVGNTEADLQRRGSTGTWDRKTPSRKPTASYGEEVFPGADEAATKETQRVPSGDNARDQSAAAEAKMPLAFLPNVTDSPMHKQNEDEDTKRGAVNARTARPVEGRREVSQVGSIYDAGDTSPVESTKAPGGAAALWGSGGAGGVGAPGNITQRPPIHDRTGSIESVRSAHLHMPGEFPGDGH